MTADDMLSTVPPSPKRYVIDFHPRDLVQSAKYRGPFAIVKAKVLPDRVESATEEKERNKVVLDKNPDAKVNHHHANFLKQWWLLSWARAGMIEKINGLSRYIACGQVTKRPIFEFVSPDIHPNAALIVFPFEDDYSFGVLQSSLHWTWFVAKCSTLTERFRYTSNTVFDTFPWPQSPSNSDIRAVAQASRTLRGVRRRMMDENTLTLRDLHRLTELPGTNPLKSAQDELDAAVRTAYGISPKKDALTFLLALNIQMAALEIDGAHVQGPGIPQGFSNPATLVSKDCLKMPND
jgi:hypothetical protein